MKKIKTVFLSLFVVIALSIFQSCEKDEINVQEEPVNSNPEIEAKYFPRLVNVNRYYAGPPYTTYNYNVGTAGATFGSFQGVRFKLGLVPRDRTYPGYYYSFPSGTVPVYLIRNKGNLDFMITTNLAERNGLVNSGHWQDVSTSQIIFPGPYPGYGSGFIAERPYIHTSGGSGRVKLYRFYDNQGQSIHLFTTNYNEGASKGYTLEGVVGWVHR